MSYNISQNGSDLLLCRYCRFAPLQNIGLSNPFAYNVSNIFNHANVRLPANVGNQRANQGSCIVLLAKFAGHTGFKTSWLT